MLSKSDFLNKLDQIFINENLLEKEKNYIKNIKENEDQLPNQITADVLIARLGLITIKGITDEDGYFKEFINTIDKDEIESQTEIFYLLKGKQVSCWHSLKVTETWNWLGGKEISLFIVTGQEIKEVLLNETNSSFTIAERTLFGAKITNPTDNNNFGWVTCLCKPGFEREKYINPTSKEIGNLTQTYPERNALIHELTPKTSDNNKTKRSIFQYFRSFCCNNGEQNNEQTPLINRHNKI
ncbi:MAG: cupin domain-containing protein [Candidatus Aquirickettsiella sp.]